MNGEQPLSGTRGRILELLWRGTRTVDELTESLGLTDNAVRAHLVALERDGLVKKEGLRRGARKPSFMYACTEEAERLLPKPYSAVLKTVLDELAGRMDREALDEVLRRVGTRLAEEQRPRFGKRDQAAQMQELAQLIRELGGIAEIEEREGGYRLRGYSCPLAAVVGDHPEACAVVDSLIEGVLDGASVHERCQHDGASHCAFEIDFPPPPD